MKINIEQITENKEREVFTVDYFLQFPDHQEPKTGCYETEITCFQLIEFARKREPQLVDSFNNGEHEQYELTPAPERLIDEKLGQIISEYIQEELI